MEASADDTTAGPLVRQHQARVTRLTSVADGVLEEPNKKGNIPDDDEGYKRATAKIAEAKDERIAATVGRNEAAQALGFHRSQFESQAVSSSGVPMRPKTASGEGESYPRHSVGAFQSSFECASNERQGENKTVSSCLWGIARSLSQPLKLCECSAIQALHAAAGLRCIADMSTKASSFQVTNSKPCLNDRISLYTSQSTAKQHKMQQHQTHQLPSLMLQSEVEGLISTAVRSRTGASGWIR